MVYLENNTADWAPQAGNRLFMMITPRRPKSYKLQLQKDKTK